MRILFNATTCIVGGAVQVSTSFILRAVNNSFGHDIFFYVSKEVFLNLQAAGCAAAENVKVISDSPSRSKKARKELKEFEIHMRPDLVFTVFGPSYVNFSATHVCGFADGWLTHPSDIALNSLGLINRIRNRLKCAYKKYQLSVSCFYWVEAEVARKGLAKKINIDVNRIRVIPNSYSEIFEGAVNESKGRRSNNQIFTLAHPYVHKNISIVPKVASLLKNMGRHVTFILTLPNDGKVVKSFWLDVHKYGVNKMIRNVGPLKVVDCVRYYTESTMLFLPTLLETFSATFPESMKMELPIVTSDLDFAHEVCADAALYFDPTSASSAATAICEILDSPELRHELANRGLKVVDELPSPNSKYQMLIKWLEEVHEITGEKHLNSVNR